MPRRKVSRWNVGKPLARRVAGDRGRLAGAGGLGEAPAQHLELAREVLRGGVALLRVLGQAALDDPAERGGQPRRRLEERLGLLPDDGGERLRGRVALEGLPPRGHLVEDRAERELVGAEVHRPSRRLLGRHVADRAEDGAGLRARDRRRDVGGAAGALRLHELGEAEVEDLEVPVARDHEVVGLQVAVDDAVGVGAGEAARRLHGQVEDPARRRGAPRRGARAGSFPRRAPWR